MSSSTSSSSFDDAGMLSLAHFSQNLRVINLSYCSITDVGLLALASINYLQIITILHLRGLTTNGLAAAILACGGLTKVKFHASFKPLLSRPIIDHIESRGCIFPMEGEAIPVVKKMPRFGNCRHNWYDEFWRRKDMDSQNGFRPKLHL